MKKNLIKAFGVVAAIAMLATGCKKDDNNTKTYLISALADTAGVDQTTFEYDGSDRVVRIGSGASNYYNFFYKNNLVDVRTTVAGGTVTQIDSFYYDGNNRVVRVEDYTGAGIKKKTTTLAYNGNGSINSATVDYVDPLVEDELYDYTYNGQNIAMRTTSVKQLGTYKLKSKLEYLGSDDKTNPFVSLYKNGIPDEFSTFFFIWSGANNPTSAKQTDYDAASGNVTTVTSATVTYEYNSDNMPTKLTNVVGTDVQKLTFKYITK